ncbi:MAG: ATP-binding cassette domain-containing protein [Xanthomonadales bacterium]|nr:ABC transporter ATP-binding protein [Xanthomonadales bacterium]NIX12035.1 ATP-binding cassette domain-containing protein [Xanthomonadales bacterium]
MGGPENTKAPALLEVCDLGKSYTLRQGSFSGAGPALAALDGVSFSVERGQVFGLVGESGSGKSTLGRTIVGLARPDSGRVLLEGRDLSGMGRRDLMEARRRIQVIFQDPGSALSPRRTVLQILTEPLNHFGIGARRERPALAAEALETVGLDAGALARYPHQFSSGQRQRIGIARALLAEPDLVIADEAVSALDVSVQAQVLELMRHLRDERGIAFLMISHDLAVIRQLADVIGVMYRGQLVEYAGRDELFQDPHHPYTRQLLAAIPDPDPAMPPAPTVSAAGLARLPKSPGCVFAHRCDRALAYCNERPPGEHRPGPAPEHRVKCHLYQDGPDSP